MKFTKLFSAVLFAGLLKVNAQDCDTVKNILRNIYQIDEAANCCQYAVNDQYAVSCSGDAVTSLAIVNSPLLTEVPADVASLASLESLDVSNCNIQQFPSHLKSLQKLKSLALTKNSITELPEDVGQFAALEKLDLGENSITAVPASIGNLANLKTLNLYRNSITALPDTLFQINLQKLNIESNQDLTGVLKKFGGAPELCNIKNTHLCIEDKGICKNYVVNNTRMPYCHPENFTEEELETGYDGNSSADSTGSNSGGKSKTKTILIICGVVAAVLVCALLAFLLIKKNKKADNAPYGNVDNKMGENARLENNYGRNPNNNYQQVNQQTVPNNSYSVDINPLVKH